MFLLDPEVLEPAAPGQPVLDLPVADADRPGTAASSTGDLIFSASDLVAAAECEYRTLRILDERLGRTPNPGFPEDPMLQRAATLGDAYEARVLAELVDKHGPWDPATGRGVKIVERAQPQRALLEAKREETLAALRGGADVVFQATFFDGSFVGFADFLVRQEDGSYAVWDTKLARHAKTGALLQLAAYGDQLAAAGIPLWPRATLVLGDRSRSDHSLADLMPVFRERRARFRALTAGHRARPEPVPWGQDGLTHCGRCDYCTGQLAEHRDLLLVNGMTGAQRAKLTARGVTTIDELAALPASEASGPLARLRDQARMQLGLDAVDGTAVAGTGENAHPVSYKVLRETVSHLPAPSDGDIFFDFEGDPLWQDPLTERWGIEYLFGALEIGTPAPGAPTVYRPFWAHSRSEERAAFVTFLEYVEARRRIWPDLHVYHYAPYEKSALRNLSVLHGTGEDVVDEWLRTGLLVDLLDAVRHSLRISEASYSIKKLEPFYMDGARVGEVTNAGASVVAYADYCAEYDAGLAGDTVQAAKARETLASIAAYNEYDCVSTLRLRDWLLRIGAAVPDAAPDPAAATMPAMEGGDDGGDDASAATVARLQDFLAEAAAARAAGRVDGGPGEPPSPTETAVAMVAAAAGYHRREAKQFWWGHFDRLEKGPGGWVEERNLFSVEDAEVVDEWDRATPRARTDTRTLWLRGTATEGSEFRPGEKWFGMYQAPLPDGMGEGRDTPPERDGEFNFTILEDVSDPATPELTTLLVAEKSTQKVPAHPRVPVALTPDKPVYTTSIRAALAALAEEVAAALPSLPRHPGLDILRRARPRLADGGTLPAAVVPPGGQQPDYAAAITDALVRVDRSYLAVQGPPGTGKTHVGSRVIAALMERGWKIGVVAQSHAVVENLLRTAIEKAGVDPARVGKAPKRSTVPGGAARETMPWQVADDKRFAGLLGSAGGALIGGTAWTMTGANVPPGSLDLLVIDEAGQFSLANTLAVAQSARRLLLLGDPQQLPQVTQGSHPEPVDVSALGWLSDGHATLPAELGYFLADSWRMHPELCAAVSRLSYEDRLVSAPAAALRRLEGRPAGVETVYVQPEKHSSAGRENKQSSPKEAAEVVAQVRAHLGLPWTEGPGAAPRPLGQEDVLVVAAYNAQVHLVRGALDAAGLPGVRVGTVDRFQGQEAPVVLVTMACADPSGAPRGMEFLLNRNRINVAVSRGKWRAVVIRSPQLTAFMPSRPSGLAELGAFIGLCGG